MKVYPFWGYSNAIIYQTDSAYAADKSINSGKSLWSIFLTMG